MPRYRGSKHQCDRGNHRYIWFGREVRQCGRCGGAWKLEEGEWVEDDPGIYAQIAKGRKAPYVKNFQQYFKGK